MSRDWALAHSETFLRNLLPSHKFLGTVLIIKDAIR
jgi:hypothetical protein